MQIQRPPVKGCWVAELADPDRVGSVKDSRVSEDLLQVCVLWAGNKVPTWVNAAALTSGLKVGSEVEDVPYSRTRISHGIGVIKTPARSIGGRVQHLVDFEEKGLRVWMPFESLRWVRSVRHALERASEPSAGAAERFRLRNLSYALQGWHENTGALSKLTIDPLPHQIHLVHHILKSGDLNWLIADDVGLGKTVEVGMLLSALKSRKGYERVLLICPAGLVKQWKDEMHYKFAISDFQIYGEDFHIHDIRDWKLHDRVIASIDLLKQDRHLQALAGADPWGLVVFDEAHRLSRSRFGMKYNTSDRFRLAQTLRKSTDSLILLSATPHQGKQDKFQALLELLHPEWRDQIGSLSLNPEILSRMVIRNNKSEVTDADGEFIFKGKRVLSIVITPNASEKDFDADLTQYFKNGYGAASRADGSRGRAIGFVMTVFRKLAASSLAAIGLALERRHERLSGQKNLVSLGDSEDFEDSPYEGEYEEQEVANLLGTTKEEFFEGELFLLERLLDKIEVLKNRDTKLETFLDGMVAQLLKSNPKEKILIFTEYRATQTYLAQSLGSHYGVEMVSLINGTMTHQERQTAIDHFESHGQFLISTEAGGEGINLQRACHVMINFDMPWNPMRLVQRIGRLYRYGQKQQVVVVNVQSPQTFDGKILEIMYERIRQVVADMSFVGTDFAPGLEDDIVGRVSDLLDVEDILRDAATANIQRTTEQINAALEKAREAVQIQDELFRHFTSFDPESMRDSLEITKDHLISFFLGMCDALNIEVIGEVHKGMVLEIKLPEAVREELGYRGANLRVSFDHTYASRAGTQALDESSPLLQHMFKVASSYKFDGGFAKLSGLKANAILTAVLRWQNDQGVRARQEFVSVLVDSDNGPQVNTQEVSLWLLKNQIDGIGAVLSPEKAKRMREKVELVLDGRLARGSNIYLNPENRQLVSAGWILGN
ncbi:MAG: helicase-related protein, partial [Candidatus Nanopelagicaceae bacterium]